jgi:hypothetical protein
MSKTSFYCRVAGAAGCAWVVLGLAGCGDRSEAAEATREASLQIDRIAGGGGGGMVNAYTIEQFEAAAKPLNRTGLDGTDAEKAAAVILASWTDLGLASGADLRSSALEREATRKAAEIRTELRAWEQLQARAAADEAIDPSEEIASLDAERGEIEAAIESATATKAEVDQKVGDLESQMASLEAEARDERAEAARLELQAARLSAVEAAELAPEIQKHKLAGEKRLLDAARVDAKADQLGTAATEAKLNLEMLNEQKALNEEARADILAAQEAARANAAALREQAAQAAAAIRTLVDELQAFRQGGGADGGLNAMYEAQIERLRSAVSGAQQGVSSMRTEAKVAMGAANVALGDALTAQARSHADLAGLLGRLAEATPALPEAAAYAEQAAEAARVAAEAREAATVAYAAAVEDYGGTGARGDAGALMDTLIERLRARAGGGSGEAEPTDGGSVEPGDGGAVEPGASGEPGEIE